MFKDLLVWAFLRKPTKKQVTRVLKEEDFVYRAADIEKLLSGNQKGTRYGNIVLQREENGEKEKRFLKLVLDGRWETFKLFRRHLRVSKLLQAESVNNIEVLKSNFSLPVVYGIFETLDDGDDYGFMDDLPIYYQRFNKQKMEKLVRKIYQFHFAVQEKELRSISFLRDFDKQFKDYQKKYEKILNKKIKHLPKHGAMIEKPVKEILAQYLEIPDLEVQVFKTLKKNWMKIRKSRLFKNKFLVHGDLQIDNVYQFPNGSFELLDFEWVGLTKNPLIPIIHDYGNLRVRAWSSPKFQELLDQAMFKIGKEHHQDVQALRSALKFGVIYSALTMSGYFLDFINTTENDGKSKQEYHQMYSSTISVLKEKLG